MGSFSDYLENKLLDHVFGNATYTSETIYVALFTATPSDAGGGTEVSGGSYARVLTTSADWTASSGGALANANDISFPAATLDWGTVTSFALFNAATVGDMLAWGTLSVSQSILSGNTAKFLAGQLDVTLD